MESLALLCTLHADGPATLKRLRRAGCDSLEAVEAYEAVDLATLLEVPPAVARRLLKEARGLSVRLEDGVLDDSEETPQICTTPGVVPGIVPQSFLDQGNLDRRDQAILGRVLDHWSDETPAAEAPTKVGTEGIVEPAESTAMENVNVDVLSTGPGAERERGPLWPEDPAARIAANEPRDSATPDALESSINAGAVEGLNEAGIAVLAQASILSLTDLVDADPLRLAGLLGVTYANARRMQFIARAAQPVVPSAGEPDSEEQGSSVKAKASTVSLSFGGQQVSRDAAQQSEGVQRPAADSIDEDPVSARKFWEPQTGATQTGATQTGATQTGATQTGATPVAEEPPVEPSRPAHGEPSKIIPAPEAQIPTSSGYSTPWAQDSGRTLTKPLEVHFPAEPEESEPTQAEVVSPVPSPPRAPEVQSTDRPLSWNFDLSGFDVVGPTGRFPDDQGDPAETADRGEGRASIRPDQDGVGGPFA